MPKDSLQITVLLASPGDIRAERKAVREAAEEINRVYGEDEGFHLVIKGWDTHTRPAAGRAQGNINRQIGPMDIFLGIMWHRLGTPTGKAASGTVEEYERARLRHMRSRAKRKPSVMFYFRSTLPRKSAGFDPDQYKGVLAFKKKVFRNDLAREYETPKEFARLVREHLTLEARAIARAFRGGRKGRTTAAPAPTPAKTRRPAPSKPKPTPTKRRRKPPLPVPRVPKTITDADRQAFTEKAFRSVRTRFERTAKAFNDEHPHARIRIQRDGTSAFTATATVEGEKRSLCRIRIVPKEWYTAPHLEYQRGELPGTGFYASGTPSFWTEEKISVEDVEGQLGFESGYLWTDADELRQSTDLAKVFWERFTDTLR